MNRLSEIFATKVGEVAAAQAAVSLADVTALARDADPPRGFRQRLAEANQPVALIAEVKKASPSMGLIRSDLDPVLVAKAYRDAGAHALSVLTDREFFGGSAENLRRARAASGLPVLRKDFLLDRYQVIEARAWGADAVLLIVAMLDRAVLWDLHDCAREWGMDVLVEVHDEAEAEVALELGADLVGINNRDLATFQTDLATTERVLPLLGQDVLGVAESAIESFADVERMRQAGARAVLIGTAFCAAPDVEARVCEVMGW